MFGKALFDRLSHAPGLFALDDMSPGLVHQLVRQSLHVVAAAPGVDDRIGIGLFLKKLLGINRKAFGEIARQCERLVECIRMQALGVALSSSHCLDAGADDVLIHILRSQRPPARLAMGAKVHALGVVRLELLHDLRP